MKICVFCASSDKVEASYFADAQSFGRQLAQHSITLVYGGGAHGLMGCIADAVLQGGGQVIGIMPRFMERVEWAHKQLTKLVLVNDMRERKKLLIQDVDAVVALPGGCGTLEELMEVVTLKRLGQFTKPIVILNTKGFYNNLNILLNNMVEQHFMRPEHRGMWHFVDTPDDILPTINATANNWTADAIKFAAV